MPHFENLTLDDAKKLIPDEDHHEANEGFYRGDHWQKGDGWVGPAPEVGDDGYDEVMTLIEDSFTSANVIKEIVDRHVAGVIGREPRWGFVPSRPIPEGQEPTQQEQALIQELESFITDWWDKRKAHAWMQKAVASLLWGRRAPLRLYVPPGRAGETETQGEALIEAEDFEAALDLLFPDAPSALVATVAEDEETREPIGLFFFDTEVNGKKELAVEVVYVNEDGDTVVRVITKVTDTKEEFSYPIGGRLPMFEMQRDLLVTEQVVEQQRALNLTLSMLPRAVVTSGFLERIILNAEMPGTWEYDEAGNKVPGSFTPDILKVGAGVTTNLVGTTVEDEDREGNRSSRLIPADVKWREPSSTEHLLKTKQEQYATMLNEADQAHVIGNQSDQPSGKSREQARTDYISSLRLTQPEAEAAGRWLLGTLVAMAEAFVGEVGRYTDTLRPYFTCRLDAGPVTPTEREQNNRDVAAGTMAMETAMYSAGIEDTEAEAGRIEMQPGARLGLKKQQADIIKLLTDAGVALKAAAVFAEVEAAEAAALEVGATDPPTPGVPGAPAPAAA